MDLPAENWFYARGGQQSGPVSLEQLRNLLLNGHIDRDRDLVWAEGVGDWGPAAKIPGLVAAEQTPAYYAPGHVPESPDAGPPIPFVKRTRFGLMMGLGIGSLAPLFAGGFLMAYGFLGGLGGSSTTLMTVGGGILMLLGLAMALTALVQFFVYLYRAWVVVQPFGARVRPGLAVGLCFVPIFHFYWWFIAFWGWAKDYNRAVESHPAFAMAPRANPALFLTYCILQVVELPLSIGAEFMAPSSLVSVLEGIDGILSIANLIILAICAFQFCNAVNFFASLHERQADR